MNLNRNSDILSFTEKNVHFPLYLVKQIVTAFVTWPQQVFSCPYAAVGDIGKPPLLQTSMASTSPYHLVYEQRSTYVTMETFVLGYFSNEI